MTSLHEPVEAFIPAAPKDYIKLPHVLRSIEAHLPDVSAAHVVTPQRLDWSNGYRFPVAYYADSEILDFDWNLFRYRPTWIRQQFIKLFQQVTASDWFIVIDADRFFNHALPLFENIHPIMYLSSRDQNHDVYFEYSRKMLGIGREYPHSFLSECTLYRQSLIEEMLGAAQMTRQQWLEKSAQIIDATCHIGDAELYGNYVYAKHPDLYRFQVIPDEMRGLYPGEGVWTDEEICKYIVEMSKRDDIDMFSAHSWWDCE